MSKSFYVGCLLMGTAVLSSVAGKPVSQRELPAAPVVPGPATNLLDYLIATMDHAVQDRDPVADRSLLLTHNDELGQYAYNTNNPAFPFHGVTGISVRGTGANCGHNGTLVAPRIVVTAGHCWQVMNSKYYFSDGQGIGAEWRFLDRNGKVHTAYAQYSRLLTNTVTGQAVDTRMFVLSNAMPASVEPALWGSPDMARKVGGLVNLPRFIGSGDKQLWPQATTVTNFAAWYRGIRGGDSGSGSFVPLGTNLVYIGNFGGDVLAEGVDWRETAEWLCRKFGHKPSIPVEANVTNFE